MKNAYLLKIENGIKLSGYLTFFNLHKLKKEGIELLSTISSASFQVDCQDLLSVHSVTLVLFLSWLKYAREKNKALIFLKVPEAIKRMAALYCLESVITCQ